MNSILHRLSFAVALIYGFSLAWIFMGTIAWKIIPVSFLQRFQNPELFAGVLFLVSGLIFTFFIKVIFFRLQNENNLLEEVEITPQSEPVLPVTYSRSSVVRKKPTPVKKAVKTSTPIVTKTPVTKKVVNNFDESTIALIKSTDVSKMVGLRFDIPNEETVELKRAALNRLVVYITQHYKKKTFTPNELDSFYAFVMKYYRTSLSSDQRKQILDILEKLTKKWGKVEIF